MRNIFQTGRPANFKLGTHTEHEDPHQRQAPLPLRSRSSGRLMLRPEVRHIFRTGRPTNLKLGRQMEDGDQHRRQVPLSQRSWSPGHVMHLTVVGR